MISQKTWTKKCLMPLCLLKIQSFCCYLQIQHHVIIHFQKIVIINLKVLSSCFFYLTICVWEREENVQIIVFGNNDFDEALPSWDNESMLTSQFTDGCVHDDMGNLDDLVSQALQVNKDALSFKHVLSTFPFNCQAAAPEDISPHNLCFICLLHLANEHGLSIQDHPSLDDLSIHLPASS